MPYRVKKAFQGFKELTTIVDGKRVALVESYEHTTAATVTKPSETIRVPLATQAELKAIFERGDPCIEQYDETKLPEPRNLVDEHEIENPFQGVGEEELSEAQGLTKKTTKTKKHEP